MNISILVFGRDNFTAKLPDQIRGATAFNVEAIANLNQAISRIQMAPPDVILVQASLDGSMELCCWLKEQTNLSWIHCILLEDRPHLLTSRSKYGREWELEMTCVALQQGADFYLWYPSCQEDHTFSREASERLLLAQLTVGLRKAQKYHDLIRKNQQSP